VVGSHDTIACGYLRSSDGSNHDIRRDSRSFEWVRVEKFLINSMDAFIHAILGHKLPNFPNLLRMSICRAICGFQNWEPPESDRTTPTKRQFFEWNVSYNIIGGYSFARRLDLSDIQLRLPGQPVSKGNMHAE
jgi:hypothetical protein